MFDEVGILKTGLNPQLALFDEDVLVCVCCYSKVAISGLGQ